MVDSDFIEDYFKSVFHGWGIELVPVKGKPKCPIWCVFLSSSMECSHGEHYILKFKRGNLEISLSHWSTRDDMKNNRPPSWIDIMMNIYEHLCGSGDWRVVKEELKKNISTDKEAKEIANTTNELVKFFSPMERDFIIDTFPEM